MTENQIIALYKSKQTTGVTEAESCYYLPLRVTGCGETVRYDDERGYFTEDRVKAEFFTQDNIDACGRLPITIKHPKDSLLDSDTIKDAEIVGNTVAAWVEGEEIWALGKLFDRSVLDRLGKDLNSTSPGVLSISDVEINGVWQERPIEINHLALVDVGHWDQKSKVAYRIDKEDKMAEEVKNDSACGEEPKADELEEKVAKLEANEAQEAEHFEEMAQEHATVEEAAEEIKPTDKEDEVEERLETEINPNEADNFKVDEEEVANETAVADESEPEEEPKADEGDTEEIIADEEESKLDAEREEVIAYLRGVCDEAHPSLGYRMPFIKDRETARSVVHKFIKLNPGCVEERYAAISTRRADAMPDGFLEDIVNNINSRMMAANKRIGANAMKHGWVDSGKGYQVRQDW